MRSRKMLTAAAAALSFLTASMGSALAGTITPSSSIIISSGPIDDVGGLPAPGVLGLVAAVIVGTILLARRGK